LCSISGFIVTRQNADRKAIVEHYINILSRGRERGHDSIGVASVDIDGESRRCVTLLPGDYSFVSSAVTPRTSALIGNNRAEPTTEFVISKTSNDIQPFGEEGIYISHNGTIANDNELRHNFSIETSTAIDSAVIPGLIKKYGVEGALHQLVGSYALAVIDAKHPTMIWLACNYKPIYTLLDNDLGAIFFASRPNYLQPEQDFASRLKGPSILQVPPYHLLVVNGEHNTIHQEAIIPRIGSKKAFIICSGGLDSTTAAKWAQLQGYDITLLHFMYHCRAEQRETEAVKAIAKELNCGSRFEDLSWLGKLGGSSLTDSTLPITSDEIGAEFAHEWVPARNLIFTAMAAGLCDRYNYDTLVMGLNLEEAGAFPDNTVEFYEALDHVCNIGTISRPQILSPLGSLVKHEIVQLALDIKAPIHLSWSCYYGGEYHCGHCGPCFMRKTAFKMLGKKDLIRYER